MTQLAARNAAPTIEEVLIGGDLSRLSSDQKVAYYLKVCESLGLNPYTKPFDYLTLNGRQILYARKDATDQLRKSQRVSIVSLDRARLDDLYVVTATARTADGRSDSSIGAVMVKGLMGEALANALMKAECVPLDSEILTRDGWKTYDRVNNGEEVLAYDLETDTCRWTPLLGISVYSYPVDCILMGTRAGQWMVVCTPDHSWATNVQTGRGPTRRWERKLIKANAVRTNHRLILAAPEVETTDSLLTPVEAAILGWAVTDGTIKRVGNSVRIGICQSKEANLEPIRELVGAAAGSVKEFVSPGKTRTFPTGRTYETQPQHWWYIPAAISRALLERAGYHDREDLPRIATRLSSPARKAMLQAFMLAEGDARGVFYNGDRHVRDAFQILSALEGLAVGKEVDHDAGVSRQRLKKTRQVAGNFIETAEAFSRPVWCPTTLYGTWVMRQGERVMITGNTKAKRRVTLSICGLGMTDDSEVDAIPGAQRADFDIPDTVDIETGEVFVPTKLRDVEDTTSSPDMVTSTDETIWKNWLKVLAKGQELGLRIQEIRLPIARHELKAIGTDTLNSIKYREEELANQDRAVGVR